LPADIVEILDYLAETAKGYGGSMKWNEEAKLKADLMNSRSRWNADRVAVRAVKSQCLDLGLSVDDTGNIVEWISKAHAGRRLRPQQSYRDFRFP
jgi:hypothetical protein